MPDVGDEIIGGSEAEFQQDGPQGYRDFMNCPWKGEAAVLKFSGGRFVGIFSDLKTAAGVFPIDGHDDNLASQLAQYFMDRYAEGDTAEAVFYGLLIQFGIQEVTEVERLDSLAGMSAVLKPDD